MKSVLSVVTFHSFNCTFNIYMDLINECEKLGDYVVNVVEARMGIR